MTSRLSRLRTRSFVSPSPLRSTFGRKNRFRKTASFRFMVLYLAVDPPITRVHVFDFSFEENNRSLEVAFEAYGAIKSVKKQTFLSNQIIFNGTRLVDVALSGVLPRYLMVDGYLCRLWYRGQPLVCKSLCRSGPQVGKLP